MTIKLITLASVFAVAALNLGCNQNADSSARSSATNTSTSNYATSRDTSTNDATSADTNADHTKVDNTKINARDRGDTNLTALDQGNSDADTKLTASVRKMVVSSTNDFSVAAKNIKIITQNGKVTLRGPVNTDSEKTQIESIAKGVAGDGNVENDLEVKATQ